jgi:predicted transcriptional regulator of viral defense system
MTSAIDRQADKAIVLLSERGMARLSELKDAGITAATLSRLEQKGRVIRLARGLYQLPDASLDAHHSLAEAAKLVPKGIICLVSALAYHDLTDKLPPQIWMAIGPKDWRPRIDHPPLRFVRFGQRVFASGIEEHTIEGVSVRIYSPGKTVVDLFRYRRTIGLNVAIDALKEVLRRRKTEPAEIARYATETRVWKLVQPYLEALTADG